MTTVSIIHFSGSGHTRLMAEAVHAGVASVPDVTAELIAIQGKDIIEGRYKNEAVFAQLAKSDAIIFGTPTYMGGPAAQFKAFADAAGMVWFQQGWKNKVAGGFTHSSSPNGDKGTTLHYLSVFAAQMGMLWVGAGELPSTLAGKTDGVNRLGSYLGPTGATPMNPGASAVVESGDLLTAQAYGQRVAAFAVKLAR
ncbi:MAG: multimeric flavodoxin WrbA [Limisphaerales bacterium]|nr:MAG: multimeric flavodoxin WrbA [Limisphaerales bacterium]TXT47792.1 MAG: multimeric flavodoxin WrbA [Limisphaerales bacterium]